MSAWDGLNQIGMEELPIYQAKRSGGGTENLEGGCQSKTVGYENAARLLMDDYKRVHESTAF